MYRARWIVLLVVAAIASACATQRVELTEDRRLNAFLGEIERDLAAHAWNRILARAEPEHRRTQVEQMGMPESQYVAELFGLHAADNNIETGERPQWSDLERIRDVEIHSVSRSGDHHMVHGTVTLLDGQTLELHVMVVWSGGEYRLTGGVG